MVYHIELWFIYGLPSEKPSKTAPAPAHEVLAAGSAEHHLWAVGRLHLAAYPMGPGWWNGTSMVVPDARTCCESYIYLIQ